MTSLSSVDDVCRLVKARLTGSNSLPNVGRLEIYYNDTWGTVCGYFFDDDDARVACYMLGFRYFTLLQLRCPFPAFSNCVSCISGLHSLTIIRRHLSDVCSGDQVCIWATTTIKAQGKSG